MRLFSTISAVVLTFSPFLVKMAVFCISEKYSFGNRNFEKLKLLEYFYPPSQHFFVVMAFNRFLVFHRKFALCQSGRMAHEPNLQPFQREGFVNNSTTTEDEARHEIKANSFWGSRFSRAFFDVKNFNPHAETSRKLLKEAYKYHKTLNYSKCQQRILNVEQSSFCP